MAYNFDRGRRAALNGKKRNENPFNHPDRQTCNTVTWERRASEWQEGWWTGYYELKEKNELQRK